MIDFNEIPAEGERWPQFARDFMQELGFHIESFPCRCSDSNGDFCAVEQVPGKFNQLPFRWFVSCKHKAATRTAVRENDEPEILERVRHTKADGFVGFYSTPISPALGHALAELKSGGFLKDYRVFDAKSLESYLVTPGFGRIAARYFPKYVAMSRPVVPFHDEYLPIRCDHCAKDLLATLYSDDHKGVVVRLARRKMSSDELQEIVEIYFACKGECDERLQIQYCNGTNLGAANWTELSDLVMPPFLLERITSLLDQLGKENISYSDQALEKEKFLIRALAQRTFREPTPGEIQAAKKRLSNGQ